jgi:hypothetical protein
MGTKVEVRIGSLLAAAGIIWAVKVATEDFSGIDAFSFARLPRGPLEICALGIVIWLHAIWRRSAQLR